MQSIVRGMNLRKKVKSSNLLNKQTHPNYNYGKFKPINNRKIVKYKN